MKSIAVALSVLLLAACTTLHEPVPPGFSGPTAELDDSGFLEEGSKAQIFAATEIDGKTINNAIFDTRRASQGKGFSVSPTPTMRAVPAQPIKVKLVGTHQTGAPIHEIASRAAGTFFSVEGVVDFKPEAGARYVVKGELKKEGSAVWIEEFSTGKLVTERVTAKK